MNINTIISFYKILILLLFVTGIGILFSRQFSPPAEASLKKLEKFTRHLENYTLNKPDGPEIDYQDLWYTFVGVSYSREGEILWWKEMELQWYRPSISFIELNNDSVVENLSVNLRLAFFEMRDSSVIEEVLNASHSDHQFFLSDEPTTYRFKPFANSGTFFHLIPGKIIFPGTWEHAMQWCLLLAYFLFFLHLFRVTPGSEDRIAIFRTIIVLIATFSSYCFLQIYLASGRFSTIDHINIDFLLLLGGCCTFFLACHMHRFKIPLFPTIGKPAAFATNVLGYTLIFIFILLFVHLIRWNSLSNNQYLNLDQLFNSPLSGILQIIGILIFLAAIFIFQHKLYHGIISRSGELTDRLIAFGMSLAILAFFLWIWNPGLPAGLPAGYIFLGIIAYISLLDLFMDTGRMSISWLIWWMIVTSSFVAMLLFHSITERQSLELKTRLASTMYESDTVMIQNLLNSFPIDRLDSLGQTALDRFDRESQTDLNTLFHPLKEELLQIPGIRDVQFYLLNRQGELVMDLPAWSYDKFLKGLQVSQPVHRSVFFNPLDNQYFLSIPYSPDRSLDFSHILYIKLLPIFKVPGFDPPLLSHKTKSLPLALYQNGQLIFSDGFGYPESLEAIVHEKGEFILDGEKWIIEHIGNERVIAGKFKYADLLKPVSLFSYVFSLLGLILVSATLLNRYFQFLPGEFNFTFTQSSLRNRIQISVISLIVFAFIIIGIVSIYYFFQLSAGYSNQSLVNTVTRVNNNLEIHQQNETGNRPVAEYVSDHLSELAKIHQADLLLFDKAGKLFNSTKEFNQKQGDIFLDRVAYESLNRDSSLMYFNTQSFPDDNGKYSTAYFSYHSYRSGNPVFVQVIENSRQLTPFNISDLIGTLLNVYVFLFLIAGAIALAVANSITYPIAVLGEKLRKFKLGKRNEPLEWESKDELGALISEYNQLIKKLDQSARVIARTERDIAWREMAKQVAHEIKNPLTPMKLSIQYLGKAIHSNPESSEQLIDRVSSTLIEQIDNLSQIANEFSNFAKLPQAQNEKILLNDVVETVHDLFRKREDMDIILQVPIDDVIVFADKNHLIRILNNLVKNAIQAIPNDRRGRVELELYKDSDAAIIKVRDNGVGIPEHMRDKVFSPNFTTKSSGTGLGLAISANMIESFNGSIYFESQEEKGSQFFISIPLMKLKDNFKEENRVSLDE